MNLCQTAVMMKAHRLSPGLTPRVEMYDRVGIPDQDELNTNVRELIHDDKNDPLNDFEVNKFLLWMISPNL